MFDYVSEKNQKKNCFFAKNRICFFFSQKKFEKNFPWAIKVLQKAAENQFVLIGNTVKLMKGQSKHQKKNGAKWAVQHCTRTSTNASRTTIFFCSFFISKLNSRAPLDFRHLS